MSSPSSFTRWTCLFLSLLLIGWAPVSTSANIQYAYKAERYVGAEPSPNPADWDSIVLPQNLGEHMSDDYDKPITVWIRFELQDYTGRSLQQSVYMSRHNMTAALFVDDEYVGGTDQAVWGQRAMGWNIPMLIDLPLQHDSQYLHIRLESGPSGTLLAPIAIGPRRDLQEQFDSRYFVQVTTSQIALAICLLMGILSFWIWFYRQNETLYLRFTVLCICYSIQSTFGFLTFIPLDLRWWLFTIHVAAEWADYLLVSYVVLALGRDMPRLIGTLFYLACTTTVLLLVVPDKWFLNTAYAFLGIGNIIVYGFGFWVMYQVIRKPLTSDLWFAIAFLAMFIFSAHDFYGVFLTSPEEYAEGVNLMHLSLPILAAAFFSHLLNRFVSALDTSEQANLELQEAATEKQRIYRDLHDDIGSKLLSIIHQEDPKNGRLAREALESIRETIYSVNHSSESLSTYVDNVLEEVQLRLNSAGIQVDIEADLDDNRILDSKIAYQVKRIIREIINNVLHHSQASFVMAHVKLKNSRFEIEVSDDGVGLPEQHQENTGLNNIRFRTDQIGAEYQLQRTDEGTNFRLTLALE